MGLVSQIAQDARVDVHRTGNMELISGQDLEAFLETAQSFGVCILGLEGFRLEGDRGNPAQLAVPFRQNV